MRAVGPGRRDSQVVFAVARSTLKEAAHANSFRCRVQDGRFAFCGHDWSQLTLLVGE